MKCIPETNNIDPEDECDTYHNPEQFNQTTLMFRNFQHVLSRVCQKVEIEHTKIQTENE